MGFILCFLCLWLADYIYFHLKYSKPGGPPVWYFFPFLGVTPFFFIRPTSLFERLFRFYAKHFPDVIITRFIHPCVFVKNEAVQEVQNSDNCLSRPGHRYVQPLSYFLTGKSTWFLFDHNAADCDWRGIRKMNVAALNVLPKQQKFQKTAVVVDHFLKTIEKQKGRLWDYVGDLTFAKIQETSNVNLGETFEADDLGDFLEYMRLCTRWITVIFFCFAFFPLRVILKFFEIFPSRYGLPNLRYLYLNLTRRLLERKMREIDEPQDFVEAVLHLKKPEDALDFIRETVFLNMMATTHTTQYITVMALTYISTHKDVQRKLHEELDRVVGTSALNADHFNQLHYLKAVCLEASRMSLPVPMLLRWTTAPTKIGGYIVDSNMSVATFLISETVNTKFFPKPDDFLPERYINDKGEFEGTKHFNAFARGKRRCSGIDMGTLSVHMYCAKILQHFDVFPERPDVKITRYSGAFAAEPPSIPLRFVLREGSPKIEPEAMRSGLTAFVKEALKEGVENQ